jgi:hypothetical protein
VDLVLQVLCRRLCARCTFKVAVFSQMFGVKPGECDLRPEGSLSAAGGFRCEAVAVLRHVLVGVLLFLRAP